MYKETLDYCKMMCTPNDWMYLNVYLDGKLVSWVIEADAIEGWVLVYKQDKETGELLLDTNAKTMVTEKLTGTVIIERDKFFEPENSNDSPPKRAA